MSVLLDVNPWGIVETMTYDHATGSLIIKTEQNVGAILDNNAELQSAGFDRKSDMWPIASVPLTVLTGWMREYEAQSGRRIGDPFKVDEDWERFVYGRLDSNEFRKLRTGVFRIGR